MKKTCPQCGKLFEPWRKKVYCSEKCRKRAENTRLGGMKGESGRVVADDEKTPSEHIDSIDEKFRLRGDGPLEWIACNEVTRKLVRTKGGDAIAWVMLIEGKGWFGRIGKEFSFGPSSRSRAEKAVEARLKGEMFDKFDEEKSWSGTCWKLASGSGAYPCQ